MLDQDSRSALAGLRVLDLTGPPAALCGKLLADLASLHFWYFNTNKRSCRLDLRAAEDRQRLRELVPNVDVVLESFSPGYLDQLELAPATLRRLNHGLILASVT